LGAGALPACRAAVLEEWRRGSMASGGWRRRGLVAPSRKMRSGRGWGRPGEARRNSQLATRELGLGRRLRRGFKSSVKAVVSGVVAGI
jgi:hypothetical protein